MWGGVTIERIAVIYSIYNKADSGCIIVENRCYIKLRYRENIDCVYGIAIFCSDNPDILSI